MQKWPKSDLFDIDPILTVCCEAQQTIIIMDLLLYEIKYYNYIIM